MVPFPSPVSPWHIWQLMAKSCAPRAMEVSSAAPGFLEHLHQEYRRGLPPEWIELAQAAGSSCAP